MDPSTGEAIGMLISRIASARVLLIVAYRPSFTPKWAKTAYMTDLSLDHLERAAVEQIIARVADDRVLPASVVAEIAARTDGVPLYVEEVAKSVVESLSLRSVGGRPPDDGAATPLAVPATLQDSLMERLERMPGVKPVAQLAATLGRSFSLALLVAISPLSRPELDQALDRLVEAKVIYRSDVQNDVVFIFKHALLQDIAYQSLLKSARQQHHGAIAHTLIAQFPTLVEVEPELVAHHLTQAHRVGDAIGYWLRAATHATGRSENHEAMSHLTRARDET
jgi:predicted ATPase